MHCCKKLAVSDKVQQICVRRTQRMIDIYGLENFKSKDTWRERLQRLTVGMLEWWRRECALTAELSCLGMPPRYAEKTEMWEFLKNLVDQKKKKKRGEKRKDRCQNSVSVVRAERADSSRIFLSFLHCGDFNEKPITRLSWSSLFASASHIPVYFNWVHRDPISFVLLLLFPFCSGLVRKTRSYSLTCLPANFLHHCIGTS